MKQVNLFVPLIKKTQWEINLFTQEVISARGDMNQIEDIVKFLVKTICEHEDRIREMLSDSKSGLNIERYNLLKINLIENTNSLVEARDMLDQKRDIYNKKVEELNRMNDRLNKLEEKSEIRIKNFKMEINKSLMKEMDELWLMRSFGNHNGN